jgi:hypothetical protein
MASGECLGPNLAAWCAYPAAECDTGRRWEIPDTDPRIAGACVLTDDVDAAQPDGPPIDAGIDVSPDAAGVVQWAHAFGGSGNDPIRDIAVASDESVVSAPEASVRFGGQPSSLGAADAFVTKLSAWATPLVKRYGGC